MLYQVTCELLLRHLLAGRALLLPASSFGSILLHASSVNTQVRQRQHEC